jgi:DNA sulfur modification protein DndD
MSRWKRVSILRLEMRNFKRFYGNHALDLCPDPCGEKPLILIGADNGRGKTSIHEAINYALYEDDDLPGIATRPNYLRAVSDRLNRRALDEGKTDYAVALNLLVSDGGADRRFRIEREWDTNVPERRVERSRVRVSENGRPIDWIEDNPAAIQDFVRSLLPPRIAPFFFFDGERIQDFAEDSLHERGMVDAIEDILHINVYKQLRDDLKKYVVDQIEAHEIKRIETGDFFKLQEDAERIESELETKREREAEIKRDTDDWRARRKRAEDELRRIASPHATQRDELIVERERLDKELEQAKNEVWRGFEALPILLAGALCDELRIALIEEQRLLATPERLAELRARIDLIDQRVFVVPSPRPPAGAALSAQQSVFYRTRFRTTAEDVFEMGAEHAPRARLHDIGDAERRSILKRLEDAGGAATVLRDAIDRRERLTNDLRDVEIKLQATSDDPHIAESIKQKQDIDEHLGRLEAELSTLRGEIQRLEADLATRQRQIEERQRTRAATTEAKRVVKLAQGGRRVLDAFIKNLGQRKLDTLRSRFDEMYSRLRKPEDPVHSVTIDPETWQVVLRDHRSRALEKRVFSAGMKEMYALSLLWALSRASGQELPIVIDTPVARLDTTNRRALFEKYLPYAGHQVVVLSTDHEVDVEWAKRLAPYVSKQYRLDHDASTESTVIRTGYFF